MSILYSTIYPRGTSGGTDSPTITAASIVSNSASNITGTNFFANTNYVVLVNGVEAVNIVRVSLTSITFTSPTFSSFSNVKVYGVNGYALFGSTFTPSTDGLSIINAILATGATLSESQKTAIDNRIVAAKADGVWAKWIAYYGFVGGTAASHAVNWKNPSSYLINWFGTLTHTANGVKGDGSTGYGDTGINANTVLSFNATGYGFYLTAAKASAPTEEMGVANAGNYSSAYIYSGVAYMEICNSYIGSTANNGAKQYFSANKIGSAVATYRNGSVVDTGTITGGSTPNLPVYVFGRNANGTADLFSAAQCGGFSINSGLTATEEAANYISELAFQTALNRN